MDGVHTFISAVEEDVHTFVGAVEEDVCTFIGAVEEDVHGLLGGLALLFVAEDEVDPLVQVRTDVVALQRAPVLVDEVLGALGPRWQNDVINALCRALQPAQVEVWANEGKATIIMITCLKLFQAAGNNLIIYERRVLEHR